MYGQRFAKDLAGRLATIRHELLAALGGTGDVWPEEDFVATALPAAFRVHQAQVALWRWSQRPDDTEPSGSEESTGQYDPPGSDPDPRGQDLAMRLIEWLKILEERLLDEIHAAFEATQAAGRQEFIDLGVLAARRMAQARRALTAAKGSS